MQKKDHLISGNFTRVSEVRGQKRLKLAGAQYLVDDGDLLLPIPQVVRLLAGEHESGAKLVRIPEVGSLASWRGAQRSFRYGMLTPLQNVMIVGIRKRIVRELEYHLAPLDGTADVCLRDLLQIKSPDRYSWVTRVEPVAGSANKLLSLRDSVGIERRRTLLILDGNAATSQIALARSRVNVAVLERAQPTELSEQAFLSRRLISQKGQVDVKELDWVPEIPLEFTAFWEVLK